VSVSERPGAGAKDWFLLPPVTLLGPRGPMEICAFVSAEDGETVVVQVFTDDWDAAGTGVRLSYNDADAVDFRR
jgi:hypothetical protein